MVAVETSTRYTGTFRGRAEEASRVRHEIAGYLGTCPVADDIIFIASELAANAIVHTRSRGSTFTVRCHAGPGQARIEVEDPGGPWRSRGPGDRPHGLDIIQALTGPDQWEPRPPTAEAGSCGPGSHGEHRRRTGRPPRLGPGRPQAHRSRRNRRSRRQAACPGPDHRRTRHLPATTRRACRELARLGLIRLVPGHGYYPGTRP